MRYNQARTRTLKEATSVNPTSGAEAAKNGLTTSSSKLKAKTGNSDMNGTAATLDKKFAAWGGKENTTYRGSVLMMGASIRNRRCRRRSGKVLKRKKSFGTLTAEAAAGAAEAIAE
jgi:hypothetical protein